MNVYIQITRRGVNDISQDFYDDDGDNYEGIDSKVATGDDDAGKANNNLYLSLFQCVYI